MTFPSRRQRVQLGRDLKQFAFEQSPMFQENKIQSMEIAQTYEFIEDTPPESVLPGTLQFDQTKIVLGFLATRHPGDGSRPIYSFDVSVTGSQLIHPRQMQLSSDAWHTLLHEYIDSYTEDEVLSGSDVIEDVEELSENEVQDEIIDNLIDAGVECELYQKTMYSYATCEEAIESGYEKGVSVNNKLYDVFGTHQTAEAFDDWRAYDTSDGLLYVPPQLIPSTAKDAMLEIGDEIEVRMQFQSIIRGLGLDHEAAMNDFLPHNDKLTEMMYLIECMRKRRIRRPQDDL